MLGVFDSGLGGLTVVREIRRLLPDADIAYVGDTAHVPYGGRPAAQIREFSLGMGRFLIDRLGADALVIACNTATAAAGEALRAAFAEPVIAMEPGIKPAARLTRSGVIGVLATEGTLQSERLGHLIRRFAEGITVIRQPCPGLVEAIEAGDFCSERTRSLVERCVAPLRARGADVLVLGCTHYPALRALITQAAGPDVALVDTGEAVARRVREVAAQAASGGHGALTLYCAGDIDGFGRAAAALLGEAATVRPIYWKDGELYENATS